MKLGIVGSEEAKFTPLGKYRALQYIKRFIGDPEVECVISGGCHLGGIDIWTEEIARKFHKNLTVHLPTGHYWSSGFMPRNIKIAEDSDKVICLTVDKLPPDYQGMVFDICYHCERYSKLPYPPHIKSGGCWTMWYALNHGKEGKLIVVNNF